MNKGDSHPCPSAPTEPVKEHSMYPTLSEETKEPWRQHIHSAIGMEITKLNALQVIKYDEGFKEFLVKLRQCYEEEFHRCEWFDEGWVWTQINVKHHARSMLRKSLTEREAQALVVGLKRLRKGMMRCIRRREILVWTVGTGLVTWVTTWTIRNHTMRSRIESTEHSTCYSCRDKIKDACGLSSLS